MQKLPEKVFYSRNKRKIKLSLRSLEAKQLIRNQQIAGSNPAEGFNINIHFPYTNLKD